MSKILLLTPELPWPANSGGRIKSWKLIEHLGKHYELHIGSLLKTQDQDMTSEFFKIAPIDSLKTVEIDSSRSVLKMIKSLILGLPLNVIRTKNESIAKWVKSEAHHYDLLFVDHYEMMQYIPAGYLGKVVLHQHNAYYQLWRSYAKHGDGVLKRVFSWIESFRVAKYESNVCNRADLVFAAPNDIVKLKNIGVEPSRMAETLHLGDPCHLNQPDINWNSTQQTILYVGHLRWEPNVQGLLWYLKKVWPIIIETLPDTKLNIVGANPDPRLIKAVARARHAQLVGYQDDLEPWMRESRVFAAPLLVGSGIKVKVLTGMARGLPTVTTPVGVEGLILGKFKAVAVAEDKQQMALETLSLLSDPEVWHAMRKMSRRLIKKFYTWDIVFSKMQHELDCLMSRPVGNVTWSPVVDKARKPTTKGA
jgi:glycosyltransferase involved in cell wall biosynthesis